MEQNNAIPSATATERHDDQPVFLGQKRITHSRANIERDSQIQNARTSAQGPTPPTTPHRSKKRVRFSEAGLSTGLTPFIARNSIASPPPSRTRRSSTPSRSRWNLAVDDTPISGERQFEPLRQVLSGRVKRSIKRHRLSEEQNSIEQEKKDERREIEQLREQVRLQAQEIQQLKEEQDVARQIKVETGIEPAEFSSSTARIIELQRQIAENNAELQLREASVSDDGGNWTMHARDPYDADITIMDEETFNAETTDLFHSTPSGRAQLPSPLDSAPSTPSRAYRLLDQQSRGSTTETDAEAEKQHLEQQVKDFQEQLDVLKQALELNHDSEERLAEKLAPFMTSQSNAEGSTSFDTLDAALDIVITQLAITEAMAQDNAQRYSALSSEIEALFPPSSPTRRSPSSSPLAHSSSPDSILQSLKSRFRTARIELERLFPGEQVEGFDNSKLLEMLVSRLKVLTKKVRSQDSAIDQYHEQELSLRQQLATRHDVLTTTRAHLATAEHRVQDLSQALTERDVGIERLTSALESYRNEVTQLENLVHEIECLRATDVTTLTTQLEATKEQVTRITLDAELERDVLLAAAEGREMLIAELEGRLRAATEAAKVLQMEVERTERERDEAKRNFKETRSLARKLASASTRLREEKKASEEAMGAQVADMKDERTRLNQSLHAANECILALRREMRLAKQEAEKERERNAAFATSIQSVLNQNSLSTSPSSSTSLVGTKRRSSLEHFVASARRAGSEPPVLSASRDEDGIVVPAPRAGEFLNAEHVRGRGRMSNGKKRRRYDSGLGFLDEEVEVEMEDEGRD